MDDKSIIADQLNDLEELMTPRRKELLTWWLKFFSYIFLLTGAFALFIYPSMFLFGLNTHLQLYGLTTSSRTSILMFIIIALYVLKGAASYGLLAEKDWGVDIALVDGWVGILTCSFVIIYDYFGPSHVFAPFRLELLFLIGYISKLMKIRADWKRGRGSVK
ncbi:hypothetical protein [Chitinophaga rhizophila]|uniref:Uncharacterized protein n=1 Tax=Chitinophaga rhizophila TaxID=2866212 RepID=A0ABS7GMU9_9BACT|nr:hypothetical protein [Chitinophaga rhizophila]MBW8688232.1 hypothetical protein [Chitinophaga rhizophila]